MTDFKVGDIVVYYNAGGLGVKSGELQGTIWCVRRLLGGGRTSEVEIVPLFGYTGASTFRRTNSRFVKLYTHD
jgi:hypothetical protein